MFTDDQIFLHNRDSGSGSGWDSTNFSEDMQNDNITTVMDVEKDKLMKRCKHLSRQRLSEIDIRDLLDSER